MIPAVADSDRGARSMEVSSTSRAKAASGQKWAEMPADVVRAFLSLLPRSDLRSALSVCAPWNQLFWLAAEHLDFSGTPCLEDVNLLRKRLPNLCSLSLKSTRSLFQLPKLTQLTSITLRCGGCCLTSCALVSLPEFDSLLKVWLALFQQVSSGFARTERCCLTRAASICCSVVQQILAPSLAQAGHGRSCYKDKIILRGLQSMTGSS